MFKAAKITSSLLKSVLVAGLMFCVTLPSHAQLDDLGTILQAGVEDAELLSEAYLEPFANGFGSGLNAGWVNTARPHKKLGFHLMIRPSLVMVPDADQSFDITELGLSKMRAVDPNNTITPTVNGDNNIGPEVAIFETGPDPSTGGTKEYELASFNMPQGTGIDFVPAPTIQAGVGLIKNTEIMLRYTPEIALGDFGDIQTFGGGIKHDVMQWIPGGKFAPVDVTIMAAYQKLTVGADLNLDPNPAYQPDPDYNGNYDNQRVEMNTTAYTIDALVGKTLPFISVYGGIGMESTTMDVDMKGDYPVPFVNNQGQEQIEATEDPISLSMEGNNGIHALAGLRVKITVLTIYAEYKLANYQTVNAGIGVSFR